MPFKSKSQARKLYATKPALAKEFAKKTKSIKALPEKVKSPKVNKPSKKKGKKTELQPIEERREM
jgi:hypothetical protein